MTIRFQDSLEVLAGIAAECRSPLDDRSAVVRDGAGRLMLAQRSPSSELTAARLRTGLDGYASPVPLVSGRLAERLLSDPTAVRTTVSDGHDGTRSFLYVDRRIVGMDWLRQPAQPRQPQRRIVFSSLKGGVGRSTALAVVAAYLARLGKRVLILDLDLEAPGIGSMLLPASADLALDRRPMYGVVDYLVENGLGGIGDEELSDFVGTSPLVEGSIDIVPAVGRRTDQFPEAMMAKLSRALVEDRQGDLIIPLAEQVASMVSRFEKHGDYDVVLVDSRAGMSEISAAPLLALGAEIMFFGTNQPQTFQGYAFLLSSLMANVNREDAFEGEDWRDRINFVHSKSMSTSDRDAFRLNLYDFCTSYLYDRERLDALGVVVRAKYAPIYADAGAGVPHDASHIRFDPTYNAFDPVEDRTRLDPEAYDGPFGAFIRRACELVGITGEQG